MYSSLLRAAAGSLKVKLGSVSNNNNIVSDFIDSRPSIKNMKINTMSDNRQ